MKAGPHTRTRWTEPSAGLLLLTVTLTLVPAARGQQSDRDPLPSQLQGPALVLDSAPRIADPKLAGGEVLVTFHLEQAGASVPAALEIRQGER